MIIVFGIPLIILPTCSMNLETAVTIHLCHFNQVIFAVYKQVMDNLPKGTRLCKEKVTC